MRINRYIALATGISRRQADRLVQDSKVRINDLPAQLSDHVTTTDAVFINKKRIFLPLKPTTIMLNKPVGYVCSRNGQGSKTIYNLLPPEHQNLKPVGRLDKDSSGLLLLTDDGQLAHELTHPKFNKDKVYEVVLDSVLQEVDRIKLAEGIQLKDGLSKLQPRPMDRTDRKWQVTLQEGRNRQIRRTFAALGYTVKTLHRTHFGDYTLKNLATGLYTKK
jgi:pseudouridine synthase